MFYMREKESQHCLREIVGGGGEELEREGNERVSVSGRG